MTCTKFSKEAMIWSSNRQIEIQRADLSQMTLVADLIRSSKEWYRKLVNEKDFAEHDPDKDWIAKNYLRREFYLGLKDNRVFGTISLQTMGPFMYLGYIYLNTDFVGQGLGHQLMTFAMDQAIRRKCRAMVLLAHPDASWAIRAYKKFGFRCIATGKQDVLAWSNGALGSYYEENFCLYQYSLTASTGNMHANLLKLERAH